MYLQAPEIYLPPLEIDLQPPGNLSSVDLEIHSMHPEIDSRCMPEHLRTAGTSPRLDAPPPRGRESPLAAGHGPPVQMTSQGPREER